MKILKSLISLFFLKLHCQANAEHIAGRVVSVANGDTITVLDSEHTQHKFCRMGIDAPEKTSNMSLLN